MNQYPCYIKINEAEGSIFTTGIEFRVFMDALFDPSRGLLVLSGYPYDASFDMHTRLEYIPSAGIPAFSQENVYDYGDFCWVDFQSEDDLQTVSDGELAELLFAAHMKRPLDTPLIDSLRNSYLYLCHDDGHLVRVYMRDTKTYRAVIEQKIRSALMGRKKSMSPMPEKILDALYRIFVNGGIIDFGNTLISSDNTEVIIYPARNTEFCPDDIHEELDHQRKIRGIGRYLGYNSKTQKWSLDLDDFLKEASTTALFVRSPPHLLDRSGCPIMGPAVEDDFVNTVSFAITVENFMWIDGGQDNPEDLCAHADVTVLVGDETLHDSCCASASAMRMLRTLSEDHTDEDSMHGQQMLPCCGHSMFSDESLENVYISGCCGGTDYAVRHEENFMVIVTEGGNQYAVRFEDYRREVLSFARQVEAFYNQCSPKKLPDDDLHRNGYIAFWNEWKRRMAEEEKRMQTL